MEPKQQTDEWQFYEKPLNNLKYDSVFPVVSAVVLAFVGFYLFFYFTGTEYGSIGHAKRIYGLFVVFNVFAMITCIISLGQIPSFTATKQFSLKLTISVSCSAIGNTADYLLWLFKENEFKQSEITNLLFMTALILAISGFVGLGRLCKVKLTKKSAILYYMVSVIFIILPFFYNYFCFFKNAPANSLTHKEFIFGLLYSLGIAYLASLGIYYWLNSKGTMRFAIRLFSIGAILLSVGCMFYSYSFLSNSVSSIPSHPLHIILALGYVIIGLGVKKTAEITNEVFNINSTPFPPAQALIEVFGYSRGMDLYSLMESEIKEAVAAREKAEEANHAKSMFVAMMSHELKTPLTAIKGYGQILTDPKNSISMSKVNEIAEQIVNNSNNLQEIIESVLRFSQLETGKYSTETSQIALNSFIEKFVSSFVKRNNLSENHLSVVSPNESVSLNIDISALHHILQNLLSNALKFGQNKPILLEFATDINNLIIIVKDQGIGVSEQYAERVFEPFFQISQGNNRKYGGSGLGLTIVSQIVKYLGGNIKFQSKPGEGSRFEILLPGVIIKENEEKHVS